MLQLYSVFAMRRRHTMTVRVDDTELEIIESMAKDLGVSRSEVWRRLLVTVAVLYSNNLPLKDSLRNVKELEGVHQVLKNQNVTMTLSDALKSIPELGHVLSRRGGLYR
ncbi:MAG: ribbon-helix-helix protein, CopG family [Candidatus Bathyarchaeia archaeon]